LPDCFKTITVLEMLTAHISGLNLLSCGGIIVKCVWNIFNEKMLYLQVIFKIEGKILLKRELSPSSENK
jgi:hypothetical protein